MTVAHLDKPSGENPMGNQQQGVVISMIPNFERAQAAAHVKKIEVIEVKKDPPVHRRPDPESLFGGLY